MTSQCLRGGSWDNFPRTLRFARRSGNTPDTQFDYLGFRILTQPARHPVIRGGSWDSTSRFVRSADRDWLLQYRPFYILGFRITTEKS